MSVLFLVSRTSRNNCLRVGKNHPRIIRNNILDKKDTKIMGPNLLDMMNGTILRFIILPGTYFSKYRERAGSMLKLKFKHVKINKI